MLLDLIFVFSDNNTGVLCMNVFAVYFYISYLIVDKKINFHICTEGLLSVVTCSILNSGVVTTVKDLLGL